MQMFTVFVFKKLQGYHFRILVNLKEKYLLIIQFIDYKNQLQSHSKVTNQSDRSNVHTFMLISITTTSARLSKPPLTTLSTADTYPLSSTNIYSFSNRYKVEYNITHSVSSTYCS